MGTPPHILDLSRQMPSRRHERGRAHLAAVLNWWLGSSSLTHDQVDAITTWVLGEPGSLISSQLSHIRNARIARPGLMLFEGMAALNAGIWRWKKQGEEACIKQYGPYSSHGITPGWLEGATWLPHPDAPDEPLCFADFVELFAGYLQIPDIGVVLTAIDGPEMSRALSALLLEHWQQAGWGPTDGMGHILAAYPPTDADRRTRLAMVVLGQADFSSEEIEDEMADLAATLETLRQQAPGSIPVADLHAELTRRRRRA